MKPIELEMNNFGPYRHVVIDFTKLAAAPLFLISGKTGAGKTTIFDGMTYALYGETTSKERDVKALHADFARHDLCSVRLVFEHEGVRYQITRQPQQIVKGRGNKLVTKQSKVSLIYPLASEQAEEINKVSQVKNFIDKLLKLNADQFSQIVLLPQGRFRKFLSSDSNEKEVLLRDLFRTELYDDWEQQIKSLLDIQRGQQNDLHTRLQTLQNRVSEIDAKLPLVEWLSAMDQLLAERQQVLQEKRQILKSKAKKASQLNDQLQAGKQVEQQEQELAGIKEQLQQLAQKQGAMQKLKKRIDQLNWFTQHQDDYINWSRGQQDLLVLQQQAKTAMQKQAAAQKNEEKSQKSLADLQKQAAKMKQLDQAMSALAANLPRYEERERLSQQLQIDQQSQQAAQQKFKEASQSLTSHQQQLVAKRQEIEQLNQTIAGKADLVAQRAAWQAANLQWQQWQADQDKIQQQNAQIKTLRSDNAEKKAQVDQAKQDHDSLQDIQIRGQIMALVKKLHDGQACPVCGSLDHPHPAELSGVRAVDNKEVKAAENKLSRLNREQAALESQLKKSEEQVQQLQTVADQDLHSLQEKLPEDKGPAQKLLKSWDQRLTDAESKMKTAEQRLQTGKSEQADLQELVKQGQDQLQQLQAAKQAADLQLAKDQASFTSQTANLDDISLIAAKRRLDQGRQQLKEYDDQLQQAQEQLSTAREQAAVTKQAWQRYSQENEKQASEQQKRHDQLQEILVHYDSDLGWNFWQAASHDLSSLTDMQTQVNAYDKQQDKLASRQSELEHQLAGQQKPDLGQLTAQLADAQKAQAAMQETVGRLQEQSDQLHADRQAVAKVGQESENLLDKMKELQTLSDVVLGKTDNKLSLERYILQNYFAEVLASANPWLQQLSNGRYYFKLDTQPGSGNGNKWSGLEVDIYDDMAGQLRSARTLSGGESFIASLSLALALSQVVQEHHGGVHIDALFVDEGFGSLDQDALDHALYALQNIKDGRMVGIISHVSELEERLPNQLQVISEQGVSHVKYQLDVPVN